ncbi:MAG: hypothetical protein JWP29_456, partial [Rhodoferax sp.]|nr:hypothetical protein [Rhodoferax sp.]
MNTLTARTEIIEATGVIGTDRSTSPRPPADRTPAAL